MVRRAMNPQREGSERVSRLLPPAFEFRLFVIFFYLWAYIIKACSMDSNQTIQCNRGYRIIALESC